MARLNKGKFTTPSNASFDEWLKERNPVSGVRDFEWINALALRAGLRLKQDLSMPANNQLLVWDTHLSSKILAATLLQELSGARVKLNHRAGLITDTVSNGDQAHTGQQFQWFCVDLPGAAKFLGGAQHLVTNVGARRQAR